MSAEGRERAREAMRKGASLYLVGPSGSGKSSYAGRLFMRTLDRWLGMKAEDRDEMLLRRAGTARWINALDLANASATSGYGKEAPLVTTASHAALIVIDDLGLDTPPGGHTANKDVIQTIFRRYDAGLPTIYTSALDPEPHGEGPSELELRYGEAGARRITRGCAIVRCGGEP